MLKNIFNYIKKILKLENKNKTKSVYLSGLKIKTTDNLKTNPLEYFKSEERKLLEVNSSINPDIPYFPSIKEILKYFNDNYKVLPKMLINFALFNTKTSDFYIEKRIITKNKERYIYIPKNFTKKIQKIIKKDILDKLTFPEEICGYIKNKNIKLAVEKHVKKDILILIDIKNFFPGIGRIKVRKAFENLGYPSDVAAFLTALTTTKIKYQEDNKIKTKCALPIGSPTSPTIANLIITNINNQIKNYFKTLQNDNNISSIDHTIYADNIIISFNTSLKGQDLKNITNKIIIELKKIIAKNKLKINDSKIRVLKKRKIVLGLSINQKININKKYYKNLRAEIHNLSFNKHKLTKEKIETLKGKLSYLNFINPNKYNNLYKKYHTRLSEIFQ
ncbi:MAG: reverse transcriptase domain-containing protein [bacterium]|nr:reverse transcriptase domain-containing protein [bacterium]